MVGITYIKARMAADNGPGRTVATETTNEAAREFTTSLTELGFQADRARRWSEGGISCSQSVGKAIGGRKLGYDILAWNGDPG
jgi:hypothetical protein